MYAGHVYRKCVWCVFVVLILKNTNKTIPSTWPKSSYSRLTNIYPSNQSEFVAKYCPPTLMGGIQKPQRSHQPWRVHTFPRGDGALVGDMWSFPWGYFPGRVRVQLPPPQPHHLPPSTIDQSHKPRESPTQDLPNKDLGFSWCYTSCKMNGNGTQCHDCHGGGWFRWISDANQMIFIGSSRSFSGI